MIQVEKQGKFVIWKLNNPPVNALTLDMWKSMLNLLSEHESDTEIQGLIITSALPKPLFTAGNDLMSLYAPATSREKFREFWLTQTQFLARLYRTRLITIACINGHAPAGGCGISLCCDLRVMCDSESSRGAKIGLNEVAIGILVPKFWGRLLFHTAGSAGKAEKLLLFGQMVTPEQALELGLVDVVVPRDQVLDTGVKMMKDLVKLGPVGRSLTKNLLREDFSKAWEAYGEQEAREAWEVLASKPVIQQVGAVLKKLSKSKM